MKSRILVLGLAMAIFSAEYGMAEENKLVNSDISEKAATEEKKEAIKFCPVCGPEEEMHGLAFSYKHEGKKYSFCSMDCLRAFKKNPEMFLKEYHSPGEKDVGHDGHSD